MLTCLSYYYTGLTTDQVRSCFDVLLKMDNSDVEYELWTSHLPPVAADGIRNLRGVNMEDPQQFAFSIYPTLHRVKAVIDFYLALVVFPKAAKDFPSKLSTSGWDLAEEREHLTTGFSGTNDNRYLLPTSIEQSDPTQQSSTNALVLSYLLQDENNHYHRIPDSMEREGAASDRLLEAIIAQKPDIRVLLDVGAQVLDRKNQELASRWLELCEHIPAAIFFTDKDELAVVLRDGSVDLLVNSPYKDRLGDCLVYLDDAHTRGTDLKLPQNARAAVTLGPKVSKDRLTQGKLGSFPGSALLIELDPFRMHAHEAVRPRTVRYVLCAD